MTQAQAGVRKATLLDLDSIATALADAFVEDPVFLWLIPPDVDRRSERMAEFFASMTRSYLRRGKPVYVVGDDLVAALWSAPGSWALPMTEVLREAAPAFHAFGGNVLRALRCQLQIESLHPKTPKHWYLAYLGTRTEHQGRGFGAEAMRQVLDQADAAGVPAYLESSNERNIPFYERHGFRIVGEIQLVGKGPTVRRMWREPHA